MKTIIEALHRGGGAQPSCAVTSRRRLRVTLPPCCTRSVLYPPHIDGVDFELLLLLVSILCPFQFAFTPFVTLALPRRTPGNGVSRHRFAATRWGRGSAQAKTKAPCALAAPPPPLLLEPPLPSVNARRVQGYE